MKRFYYFAYGSNMDVNQMAHRCQEAKLKGPATLQDYRLVERQYADIDEDAGGTVDGLLWTISYNDLQALDRYEGCPRIYGRTVVTVCRQTKSGCRLYPAIVYIMTPGTKQDRDGAEYSPAYRELCSQAAKAAGIPDAFQR